MSRASTSPTKIVLVLSLSLAAALAVIGLTATVRQPVYRIGFAPRLVEVGFEVLDVIPESPAWVAGLRSGTTIAQINDWDANALYELSVQDTPAFLRMASQIFEPTAYTLRDTDGITYEFSVGQLPGGHRLRLSKQPVIVNAVVGFALAAIGLFFIRRLRARGGVSGRDSRSDVGAVLELTVFSGFLAAASVAVLCSYFHAYWSVGLLAARFVLLDAAGAAAAILLILFGLTFPVRRATVPLWVLAGGLAIPMVVKYVLIGAGVFDLFGLSSFTVHAYLFTAIIVFVAVFFTQYRQSVPGQRRRLRWVILGGAFSVIPYLGYISWLLIQGSVVSGAAAPIMNTFSALALVIFPISTGIGIVEFDLLDVDAVLRRVTTLILSVIVTAGALLALSVLMAHSSRTLFVAGAALVFGIGGPPLYRSLTVLSARIVYGRRLEREDALMELSRALVSVTEPEHIFGLVEQYTREMYEPRSFTVMDADHTTIVYPSSATATPLSHETTDRLRLQVEPEETPSGELLVPVRPSRFPRCIIILGRRLDQDIYVPADYRTLTHVALRVAQSLDASTLYQELNETIARLEHEVAEREQTVQELSESQKRLQGSVFEKEHLIKEVHHRVKNNMQLMRSLLSLQADRSDDENTRALLEASRNRINSMALVHETLYQSETFAQIDLAEYLESVVRELTRMHYRDDREITVACSVQPVRIPMSLAVPCGLIVNELVTNAFDHAFVGRHAGSLTVSAAHRNEHYQISVTDDGIAVAEERLRDSTRLGQTLISTLATQIGGTMSYTPGPPKSFTVTFPAGDGA